MRGFTNIPSVVDGKTANLLPASVMRATQPSFGLRDRIRIAQGTYKGVSAYALSMAQGQILTPSNRAKLLNSRLAPSWWTPGISAAKPGKLKPGSTFKPMG